MSREPAPTHARVPIEARIAAAGLPPLDRAAWLEVDLGALSANVGRLRGLVPPGTALGVVVKADGYGHGMEAAARAAVRGGAGLLIVATLDEALGLRQAGIGDPVLVLYPVPPGRLPAAVDAGLELVVVDDASVAAMAALVEALATRDAAPRASGAARPMPRVHLGIDTGMARGGLPPGDAVAAARRLVGAGLGRLAGTWSHLATPEDAASVEGQVHRFDASLEALAGANFDPGLRHLDATGGLLGGAGPAYDLVRVGLAAYGVLPPGVAPSDAARPVAADLRPAMSLRARAASVGSVPAGSGVGYGGAWVAPRPTVVATLPVGYADGWARAYAGDAWGMVRGRRVPAIGRVSSDALALDVTDIAGFTADDEVVLLDAGGGAMTVDDLATLRASIAWEVLDAFSPRLARVYTDGPAVTGVRYLDGQTRWAQTPAGAPPARDAAPPDPA